MKKVILSIDVEDWYHLDYFNREDCDTEYSMLDGLEVYIDLLDSFSIPSSFFVLGEIANKRISFFRDLVDKGHDVGSHGWDHRRPLTMTKEEFRNDLEKCIKSMKAINDDGTFGYRAPCFSLDRDRLDIVEKSGFSFDSSRISFSDHPLYGSLDMTGFDNITDSIYKKGDFIEFENSTLSVLNKNIPISGGGYLRIFPWFIMNNLIKRYLLRNDIYVLYIHPFELSDKPIPTLPSSTPAMTRFRFSYGRKNVINRLKKLIDLLISNGYTFDTFKNLHKEVLDI